MELESWSRAIGPGLRTLVWPFGTPDGSVPIRSLRTQSLAALARTILMGSILLVLPLERAGSNRLAWAAAVGVTVMAIGVIRWIRLWRSLRLQRATTDEDANRAYTQAFSMSTGFALSPPLIAFSVVLLTGRLLPFLVLLPVWLAGLIWVAPRASDVYRLREEMASLGSSVDLASALTRPPTWSEDQPAPRSRRYRANRGDRKHPRTRRRRTRLWRSVGYVGWVLAGYMFVVGLLINHEPVAVPWVVAMAGVGYLGLRIGKPSATDG